MARYLIFTHANSFRFASLVAAGATYKEEDIIMLRQASLPRIIISSSLHGSLSHIYPCQLLSLRFTRCGGTPYKEEDIIMLRQASLPRIIISSSLHG